jgi:hypothetical protein
MIANDAVRVLSECEMGAIVGGQAPPQEPPKGDGDGTIVK